VTDLVVIIPSRSRPDAVVELLDAFAATCPAETQVALAVDKDDPKLDGYGQLAHRLLCRVEQAEGNMVTALNSAATHVATKYKPFAIGFMGDDHRPRTQGWDQAYLDELRKLGTGIVYGNDLLQCEKLPTQVAMTSDIVRALGYMAPRDLTHLYVDNAWLALGTELDRISYLPEVVVEHMHPVARKGEWDDGYVRVNSAALFARDKAMFGRWLRFDLARDVERVRQVMA
jgi:hypothetical protein